MTSASNHDRTGAGEAQPDQEPFAAVLARILSARPELARALEDIRRADEVQRRWVRCNYTRPHEVAYARERGWI